MPGGLCGRKLIAFLLCVCAMGAYALDLNSLKPQGYVSDFANVIDPATRSQLESYAANVEQATGTQIALVTLPSLDGQPVEDVANTLFRKWGVGKKGQDNGILLLLAIQDHKDRIEVGYGLEPILPDGFVGGVLRAERPLLQQGQYGGAMLAAAEQIGSTIAKAKGVSLNVTLTPPEPKAAPAPSGSGTSIPWPLIIVGIVILFSLFGRRGGGGGGGGGLLAGMLLGNMLGGGRRGGWGGGGFGGYDGGGGSGGFGGFGGGDSGGGGASGSW